MKYVKLFEQFEDEEESWWDEESPFDDNELKIGDYVVVLDNTMGGRFEIGGVYRILSLNGKGYILGSGESDFFGMEKWWYRDRDIRKATKKEIEVGHWNSL